MSNRPHLLSALFVGTSLLLSACSVAPPMNAQETQIKTDLAVDKYMPATRQMRDAIETQELFAQAAFWSNEYHLNPGDLESAIKLAAAVRKLGNPGRAVEITQTTRALYPKDPYLMAEYAAGLIATERSQEAITVLSQGLSSTPSYGRLWSLKGAALDQQERYAEARQHYDRALRITPNDPNVMANIGLSHALSGDVGTAEGWLRRAASMPNASDGVRQNLMLVLKLQGKSAEADKLAAQNRPGPSFAHARPAYRAPSKQTRSQATNQARTQQFTRPQSPQVAAQNSMPRARLHTGLPDGQAFTSASEAARAMAMKRNDQSAQAFTPQSSTPPPPQAYPEARTGHHAGAAQPQAPQRHSSNRRRR